MEADNEYKSIEDFKQKKGTPDAVFAGIKAANGWQTGKMVTEQEYDAAQKAFYDAPMDGRSVE